nr:hypothetical protein [Tanacetum cinerariifolium]
MDKIHRDKRKEVYARLDFREGSRERRIREGFHYSSAKTLSARYHNQSERLKVRDRLRYNDRHVLDRLGIILAVEDALTGGTLLMEIVLRVENAPEASRNHMITPTPLTGRGSTTDIAIATETTPVETEQMKGAPECMRISEFIHGVNNPKLTKRLNEHVPKTMEEMMITTIAFIRGEAAATGKKKGHTSWRTQDQSKRHTLEKRSDFRGQPREGRGFSSSGTEGPLVIEAETGEHMIHRMYVDRGSSIEVERFMNYLEEQTDGEAMINSIKNGDQPLPRVTQVSISGTSSNEQPHLKDKSMWSNQEKRIQMIDRLARSLLIQGLPNDIYSLIDSNKTAKDLWDALARHMLGSEYGEQDRKAAVLYEYEMFKATEGELLLDTYIRYLQVINDFKKCSYSKDKYELNFKFLNNLQPEWKQYATMMRQNKNLMDINIDALYNILKQNQGDVNDDMGSKKKNIVVTSDPLALIAEKTKVSKSKEKVVVSSDSKGSKADDFNELKKIIALMAKAFNQRKFCSKTTNNNLRTSSTSQSANKKQKFVKTDNKKVKKKDDEKQQDVSRVKCYNCKKEGRFSKDCKKAKVKDYEYYKTKMLLAKKDKDEQVLLVEDQAWMESSSYSDQEINANMVFMAQIEKVLSDSEASS